MIISVTIAPLHKLRSIDEKEGGANAVAVLVPLSVLVLAVITTTIGCFCYMKRRRKREQYKGEIGHLTDHILRASHLTTRHNLHELNEYKINLVLL